jgi:hypothetical protein
MTENDKATLTPRQMIADLRMQARYVKEKTPLPERIAGLINEAADELESWVKQSDRDKING